LGHHGFVVQIVNVYQIDVALHSLEEKYRNPFVKASPLD